MPHGVVRMPTPLQAPPPMAAVAFPGREREASGSRRWDRSPLLGAVTARESTQRRASLASGWGRYADATRRSQPRPPLDLYPITAPKRRCRRESLAALGRAQRQGELCIGDEPGFHAMVAQLCRKNWLVYCKRPFGGPEQVIRYLGQYTHRVAIANHRLVAMDERGVRFRTRNGQCITLGGVTFLRRWLQHLSPPGFVKMRHFGLMSAAHATTRLEAARTRLAPTPSPAATHAVNLPSAPNPPVPGQRVPPARRAVAAAGARPHRPAHGHRPRGLSTLREPRTRALAAPARPTLPPGARGSMTARARRPGTTRSFAPARGQDGLHAPQARSVRQPLTVARRRPAEPSARSPGAERRPPRASLPPLDRASRVCSRSGNGSTSP